jgi:hypothetical protein
MRLRVIRGSVILSFVLLKNSPSYEYICLHTLQFMDISVTLNIYLFSFVWWDQDLNSGLHACTAGILSFDPLWLSLHSF